MKAATKISLIVTFCLLYAAAYGVARSENWLIHRAGYYSDAGENRKVGGHYISSGDFGSPMLAPRISTAQGLATMFFWPATQAELVYWYLVEPRGSPWQKTKHGAQPERGYNAVLFFSFPCRARLALR